MSAMRRAEPSSDPVATPPDGNGAVVDGAAGEELVAACVALHAGRVGLDELWVVLDRTTLWAVRPAAPGLLVCTIDDRRLAVAHSSLARLARWVISRDEAGPLDSFSATGADWIDNLLPPGVGLLIDPTEPHAFVLSAQWLRPRRQAASPAGELPDPSAGRPARCSNRQGVHHDGVHR